jgi:hypothetical protein
MPNMNKYVFRYGETRSHDYQSIQASLEVEYTTEPDEDPWKAFEAVRGEVIPRVRQTGNRAIEHYEDAKSERIKAANAKAMED